MLLELLRASSYIQIARNLSPASSAPLLDNTSAVTSSSQKDGVDLSQGFWASRLQQSSDGFLGYPTAGFGARGLSYTKPPYSLQASSSSPKANPSKTSSSKDLDLLQLNKKLFKVLGTMSAIASKLKAIKAPGLSSCFSLVNNMASAIEAGAKGDWQTCTQKLLGVGKSALSLLKSSGKKLTKVASRSLPGVSLVVSGWSAWDAQNKAAAAKKNGQTATAVLWEVKELCDSAIAALGLCQLITAPTIGMPAALEAGILTLSLVSELTADAIQSSSAEEKQSLSDTRDARPTGQRELKTKPNHYLSSKP